jgi:phosphoglycolate phosphatase
MTKHVQTVAPTVVFDLDGTLAETAPDLIATLNVILDREGLPGIGYEEARDLIGAGARALIERGLRMSAQDVPAARLDRMFHAYLEHYAENICEKTTLFPGVLDSLDGLAARGYKLAVCTNKMEAHSLLLLDKLGIAERFSAICGRDTFPWFKPDPRHLTMTVERAGGAPALCLLVGDSKTDVDTARNAGVPSVGVPFGYTDVPMTELRPDRLIGHFDALVEAVEELLPVRA